MALQHKEQHAKQHKEQYQKQHKKMVTNQPYWRRYLWQRLFLSMVLTINGMAFNGIAMASPIDYFHLTTYSDQLSNPWVTSIVEDEEGYVWVGTAEGLNRLDAQQVMAIKGVNATTLGLADGYIWDLANVDKNRILVATTTGLLFYDYRQNRFERFGSEQLFKHYQGGGVFSLSKTATGEIWILALKGLFKLDASGEVLQDWSHLLAQIPNSKENDFISIAAIDDSEVYVATRQQIKRVNSQTAVISDVFDISQLDTTVGKMTNIMLDHQQQLWVGTRQGAVKIDLQQNKADFISALGNIYVADILPNKDGTVWFGCRQGLFSYDTNKDTVKHHVVYNQSTYNIQKRRVSRMALDRHGALWVGTDGAGLNLYAPPASKVGQIDSHSTTPFALIDNDVWAIHEDDKSYIVATNRGVQFYDKRSGKSVVLDLIKEDLVNPSDEVIYTIRAYGDDYLLGGNDGLFLLDYATLEATRLVQPMPGHLEKSNGVMDLEVTENALYIASDDAGVYKVSRTGNEHIVLGKAQGLANLEIKDIEIDADDNLWLGTRQGVSVLPAGQSQFIHFLQESNDEVLVNDVSKLLLLEPGVMLVGFYHKGLFAIDYSQGFGRTKVLDVNLRYGLTYKNIFTLARADERYLLIGTDQGLYKVDTVEGQSQMFGKNDGLPSAEFNEGAAFCNGGWGCSLGSSAGVLKIQVDELHHRMSDTRILPAELKIDSAEGLIYWSLRPPQSITVPPEHTSIFVKFTTLNYLDSHNTRVKYRLLPLHSKFTELSRSGELFLSSLPPGQYELQVQGTLNNVWMKQSYSLKMNLQGYWWQTRLAKLMFITIILLAVILIIYNRIRYIKRIKGYNTELFQRKQTLHLALWGSDVGTWQWSAHDNLIIVSEINASLDATVVTQFDVKEWLSKILPEERKLVRKRWQQYVDNPHSSYKEEYRIKRKEQLHWIITSGKVVSVDRDGRAEKMVGTFQDITEQKSLEQQRSLFGQAFESASEGIIILDESVITKGVNPAAERITGFSKAELLETSIKTLFVDGADHGYKQIFELVKSDGNWQGESLVRTKQQKECPIWLNITEMNRDNAEKHYLMLITDLSESKKIDRALRQLTNYDVLTGLANRKLFEEHLLFAIAHAKTNHERLVLLFIDIDRFKAINNRFGHNVGDIVLHKAGHRMQDALNKEAVVARFGGDKFVVLLGSPNLVNNPNTCCSALLSAFNDPIVVNGKRLDVSVTIGISQWPDDDDSGEQLLKHAEMAMYHAKEGGGNNFEYFSVSRQQAQLTRLKLEHDLSKALDKEQFSLVYQPQIDAKNNKVIGVEALIRWIHPTLGFISPEQFIPIAEANGMIIPISDWVLKTAIQTALCWQGELAEPIKMAVNISGLHFNDPSFADNIIALLAEYRLPPEQLCLEITEGMLISDIEQPLAALQKLRKLGVQVAIDDFGTGYSSLAYLKQFPVTCLKIDKSFVLTLADDKDDQAIVNSVISLGHFLGFEVLAEGVERLVDYRLLQNVGCDQVQGYYFAKPLSADDTLAFIQAFSFEEQH